MNSFLVGFDQSGAHQGAEPAGNFVLAAHAEKSGQIAGIPVAEYQPVGAQMFDE